MRSASRSHGYDPTRGRAPAAGGTRSSRWGEAAARAPLRPESRARRAASGPEYSGDPRSPIRLPLRGEVAVEVDAVRVLPRAPGDARRGSGSGTTHSRAARRPIAAEQPVRNGRPGALVAMHAADHEHAGAARTGRRAARRGSAERRPSAPICSRRGGTAVGDPDVQVVVVVDERHDDRRAGRAAAGAGRRRRSAHRRRRSGRRGPARAAGRPARRSSAPPRAGPCAGSRCRRRGRSGARRGRCRRTARRSSRRSAGSGRR